MTRAPAEAKQSLSTDERRRVQHNLDRIEDRLRDAPDGLHAFNPPADPAELAASPLPPAARMLWAQWDGLELAAGELRLCPLAELAQADADARADGRLRPDDLPIGERGGDLLVLCGDPHAEGADVVLVEEDGERLPHSTGVDLLVLAMLGEVSVLYDEEGEFQDALFKADGELTRAAERRLLRRHLDLDPDAPLARFRLAQSLRRAGELRAAAGELRELVRRAPDFAWGQHERGRVALGLGDAPEAGRAFVRAAELAADPGLRAYFLAWACLAAETGASGHVPEDSKADADGDSEAAPGPKAGKRRAAPAGRAAPALDRATLAAQVLASSPEFARAQEAALRAALESEDAARADESMRLGLAVVPGHAGLLSLRPALAELAARPRTAEDPDIAEEADEADAEIAAARAAAEADDDLGDRDARPAPRGAAKHEPAARGKPAPAGRGKPAAGNRSSGGKASGARAPGGKASGARASGGKAPARAGKPDARGKSGRGR